MACTKCLKNFHLTCLNPPLYKPPRGDWTCHQCNNHRNTQVNNSARNSKKGRNKKAGESVDLRQRRPSTYNHDLCLSLLDELKNHDCAWPFLSPVDKHQFPEYYRYIKHPMDFETCTKKLEGNKYATNDDLLKDVRLIFNNCHKFNEDESEVGQAGLALSCYFEKRFGETFRAR